MRIPTLLALVLLAVAISLGVLIYYQNKSITQTKANLSPPQNIQVVNLTDNQATITWQSQDQTTGLVSFGTSNSLGSVQNDVRDSTTPEPHITHFITIPNLTPETTYYFKVRNGPYFYPDNPQTFKTAPTLQNPTQESSPSANLNQPVFGFILNPDSTPIDEAIITLDLSGASPLSTLTTTAGNFILPLVNLRTTDLNANFLITGVTPANLKIDRGDVESLVKFNLPTLNQPLPKIILGQNSDFLNIIASASAKKNTNPLDINNDGVVNSLDLSIVIDNIGRKPSDPLYNKAADVNGDGVINQKDVDAIKKAIK